MNKTEEFIEQRILWTAQKHNLPSANSFPFQDLQCSSFANVDLMPCLGKPVYVFFLDESNWSVLGTFGITGKNKAVFNEARYSEIKDLNGFEKLREDSTPKSELNKLMVNTHEKELIFKCKSGGDYFAMWNICLMLQRIGAK